MKLFSGKKLENVTFLLFLVVCFYLCELTESIPHNSCGGERPLRGTPGDFCVPSQLCNKGILTCYGTNVLMCLPQCEDGDKSVYDGERVEEIEPEAVGVQTNDEQKNIAEHVCPKQQWYCDGVDCGEHGVCSDTYQKCVCFPTYYGTYCEEQNLCVEIDCGQHGMCTEGKCRCEDGFTGEFCEQRTHCSQGGIWLENRCICSRGYTGEHCDYCSQDGVCIPTKDAANPYTLVYVGEELRRGLLENSPPSGYELSPIKPNTEEYGCDCKLIKGLYKNSVTASTLVEYRPYEPYEDAHSDYIKDYTLHYNKIYGENTYVDNVVIILAITALLLAIIVVFYKGGGGSSEYPQERNKGALENSKKTDGDLLPSYRR